MVQYNTRSIRDLPRELEQLLGIAKQAAALGAKIHRDSLRAGISVDKKQSHSDLVTSIDRESEQAIVNYIKNARPRDAILGEEGTNITGDSGVSWIIDPLDGTTNFVHGYPFHSVAIGVEIEGLPKLGVVHDSFHDVVYSGTVGVGASCEQRSINASCEHVLRRALIGTGFSPIGEVRSKQALVLKTLLPMVRDVRRSGCPSLDICSVAAGSLDAFYESNLGRWDITAAAAIAEAAGARVQVVEFSSIPSPAVVVGNPNLCEELIAALRKCDSRAESAIDE